MLENDRNEKTRLRFSIYTVISFVFILWIVMAIELASGISFSKLGIYPRTLHGAIGIITAPLIHGDIFHLISNTLPFLLLGFLLFYFYYRIATEIFIWIYLVTGFWTWVLARNAYHIGVSGIVYGLAGFLFFSGLFRKSKQLMTISGIIIVMYGGMVYGIFPEMVEANVSWESHLAGGLAGVLLAFFFRKTKIDIDTKENDSEENDNISLTGNSDSTEIKYTYRSND